MEFRILGAMEVVDGRRLVDVGGAKERALLAELVLHANRVVSRDRLIEVAWGGNPPATASATLNTYISHLRAALEPGRAKRTEGHLLLTRPPGYMLKIDDGQVDALRFERLLDEGRRALESGDAAVAAAALSEGLGLWRGAALADFTYEPWAQAQATRLEELRLTALEERVEADLALGRHQELIGELRQHVSEHRLRERLWGQLMLALYRSGRQSEALRSFGELRRVLAEELGIDPSAPLRQLEEDILHQRGSLDLQPVASRSLKPSARAGAQQSLRPAARTNLPSPLTSFIGRESEIAVLRELCRQARLVTLTGAGGVGKSRLALEVAAGLVEDNPDGVFLVELARLSDSDHLDEHVLAALGVPGDPRQTAHETLVSHLGPRRSVLVLDNCEHVVAAAAALAETLLSAAPQLRILATSREVLRIPAETAWLVPSLPTPPPGTAAREIEQYDAVHLFVDRARTATGRFELTAENGPDIARICQRLDGIPLAIELAAARARLLSPREIADRLDDRFQLLTAGARTATSRHRTLRATVDWSWDGLSALERRVFRRLSVFVGGFTLSAAEEVAGGVDVDRSCLLEALSSLVDKSMVVAERHGGTTRYRLLETLRQYGQERLAESGEEREARDRQLTWAWSLARTAEQRLGGPGQGEWLELLDTEYDNLRAALEWAAGQGDSPTVLQSASGLSGALSGFWEVRGLLGEGRRWLRLCLNAPHPSPPKLRAKAARSAGVLAQRQGDFDEARAWYTQSLELSRQVGDQAGTASALHSLGNLESLQGRLPAARSLYEESLALGRELGDQRIIAASLTNLGWIAKTESNFEWARTLSEGALHAWRELGDRRGEAQSLTALAYLALLQGDYELVRHRCAESLAIQRELGDRYGEAWSLTYLGWAAQWEGGYSVARGLHQEALRLRRDLGDRYGEAWSLSHLGDLERAAGDHQAAGRFLDQALAIARQLGDTYCVAWTLLRLGKLAWCERDGERAGRLFRDACAIAAERGDRVATAECIEGLAAVALGQDQYEWGVRLLGAAAATRRAVGAPVPPADQRRQEEEIRAAREALGDDAFTGTWESGEQTDLVDVLLRQSLV